MCRSKSIVETDYSQSANEITDLRDGSHRTRGSFWSTVRNIVCLWWGTRWSNWRALGITIFDTRLPAVPLLHASFTYCLLHMSSLKVIQIKCSINLFTSIRFFLSYSFDFKTFMSNKIVTKRLCTCYDWNLLSMSYQVPLIK